MNKAEQVKRYRELAEWHDDQAKITGMCSLPNRSDNHAQSAIALRRLAEVESLEPAVSPAVVISRDVWLKIAGDYCQCGRPAHIGMYHTMQLVAEKAPLYRLPAHKE